MKSQVCPLCRKPLDPDASGWKRTEQQTYAAGVAVPVLPAGTSWERREPARSAELSADVGVPFLQSAVTGFVGAVVGVVVGGLPAGAVAGGLCFGCAWVWLLVDHRRLLWTIEKVTGADIDDDGHIGEPEPNTVRVEIDERHKGGQSLAWLELPIDETRLHQFARSVAAGRSLSESQWTGQSKPFTRDEFRELRDTLIEKGLARWRNPQAPKQGWELTRKGQVVFSHLASIPPYSDQRTQA